MQIANPQVLYFHWNNFRFSIYFCLCEIWVWFADLERPLGFQLTIPLYISISILFFLYSVLYCMCKLPLSKLFLKTGILSIALVLVLIWFLHWIVNNSMSPVCMCVFSQYIYSISIYLNIFILFVCDVCDLFLSWIWIYTVEISYNIIW